MTYILQYDAANERNKLNPWDESFLRKFKNTSSSLYHSPTKNFKHRTSLCHSKFNMADAYLTYTIRKNKRTDPGGLYKRASTSRETGYSGCKEVDFYNYPSVPYRKHLLQGSSYSWNILTTSGAYLKTSSMLYIYAKP